MRILGEEIRLKENLGFSLKRYSIWWFALLITIIFDYFSTLYFVQKYGVKVEGNLLVKGLITHHGVLFGVLVAKILQVSAVAVFASLHQKLGNVFLFIVIFFNLWAVFVNTH